MDDAATSGPAAGAAGGAGELTAVRELVLRAHPAVVPELVTGDSVAALVASVAEAEAAYQRIAAAIGEREPGAGTRSGTAPPRVPAGDTPAAVIDAERLPAAEKIRRGLARRQR